MKSPVSHAIVQLFTHLKHILIVTHNVFRTTRCLLTPKAQNVMNVIGDVLKCILRFRNQLATGVASFSSLHRTYLEFTRYSNFLYRGERAALMRSCMLPGKSLPKVHAGLNCTGKRGRKNSKTENIFKRFPKHCLICACVQFDPCVLLKRCLHCAVMFCVQEADLETKNLNQHRPLSIVT